MKKNVRTLLIAGSVFAGIVIVAAIALFIIFKMQMKQFITIATGQCLPSVYAVESKIANMFLLPDSGGTFLAIDAGSDPANVAMELSKIAVEPGTVKTVLCTHSDWDHVGGITVFPGADVIIADLEKQMVDGSTARAFGLARNKLQVPYRTVADGALFAAGSHRVRAISTPGHTTGSMCWIVDDTLLFSGDAFGIHRGQAGVFSRFFNMNTPQQVQSIARIAGIQGVRHVFTAHHGKADDVALLFRGK